MELSNKKNENNSPNISFCKTIKENQSFNTFDVFKMEAKDDNSKFIYGYLAFANNKSKSIDIYKIYPKNDFKIIQSIKVDCNTIDFIKYFYDPFLKVNYITALINKINEDSEILIWKIVDESKYILTYNYTDDMLKKPYMMSVKIIFFRFFSILFTQNQFFLIIYYKMKFGKRAGTLDIINLYNKIKLFSPKEVGYFTDKKIIKVFHVNRNNGNYLGVLDIDSFRLLKLLPDDKYNKDSKEMFDSNDIININFNEILKKGKVIDGILSEKNNNSKYLFTCHKVKGKYYILKTDIKYNQIVYKAEINTNEVNSMLSWNDNYLVIFEKEGKNIVIFDKRTCKIEKKLINGDKSLINGKKINIHENEELLFGIDENGILNVWNNQ